MTMFDEREKAYENAFAHDEEMRFKAHARCARLLGQWAAERMELSSDDAAAYVRRAVEADVSQNGMEKLLDMLLQDLTRFGYDITMPDLRVEADSFMQKARKQISAES